MSSEDKSQDPTTIVDSLDAAGVSASAVATIRELRERLREAEETLNAIRSGEVDAVVVGGPNGQQVYTLANADRPYRVLVEQMREGAVTLTEDATLLYCNRRFASIVGSGDESLAGQSFARFLRAGDFERLQDMLIRARDSGQSGHSAEMTLLARAVLDVPVNVSLVELSVDVEAPRMFCAIITDLTQNHRRTQELAAANARLAREIGERSRAEGSLNFALAAADMGMWEWSIPDGAFERSRGFDKIFGILSARKSCSLQSLLQQFVAQDRRAASDAFAGAQQGGAVDLIKRITRAADGEERWVHVIGRTHFEAGKPIRIAGVVSDISERRQIEEQLRQSQKMEAVGQLTGGIAHDFNNLLMVIRGNLELLRRRSVHDDTLTKFFDSALHGVERGANLTNQLLAFSRRQVLHVETLNVNELLPTFQHLLDRSVGELVALKFEATADLWFCATDRLQLETAILNLAINSRDAMPKGGTLVVSTENRLVTRELATVWGSRAGEYVAVVVTDDGEGMAAETLERAFEPFFTTKEVGKGTGLGLSQVYGFARQSEGFVTIDSTPGKGTQVAIHMPRRAVPQVRPVFAETESQISFQSLGTILVVEDDRDVRATARAMIQDLGYVVHEADSVAAALLMLDRDHGIDLVFSDVIMPGGMNGIDLARKVVASYPTLRVLLTSGFAAPLSVSGAELEDVFILRKPYAQTELARAISHATRRP